MPRVTHLALSAVLSLGCVHDWDTIRDPGVRPDASVRRDTGIVPLDTGERLDVSVFDIPRLDVPVAVDQGVLDVSTVDQGSSDDRPGVRDVGSDRPGCTVLATLRPDGEGVARATTPSVHQSAQVLTVSESDDTVALLHFTPGDTSALIRTNRVILTLHKATTGCTGACPQAAGTLSAFLLTEPDFDPATVTWAQRRAGQPWMIASGAAGRGADVLGVGEVTDTTTVVTVTLYGASADPLVRAVRMGTTGLLIEALSGAFTAQSRALAGDATGPTLVFQECL